MSISSSSYEAEDIQREQLLPELTPEMDRKITELFNSKAVTQKMDGIGLFGRRADDTRLALGQGVEKLFRTIDALDEQALFQKWSREGRPLTYKWFIDPNNYRNIADGNYKNWHNKNGGYAGELAIDWEAAERDYGELSTGSQ